MHASFGGHEGCLRILIAAEADMGEKDGMVREIRVGGCGVKCAWETNECRKGRVEASGLRVAWVARRVVEWWSGGVTLAVLWAPSTIILLLIFLCGPLHLSLSLSIYLSIYLPIYLSLSLSIYIYI